MTRKQNDAPIKLIHILPDSQKSPSSDSVDSSPTSYRLGIEGSSHSVSNMLTFVKKLLHKSLISLRRSTGNLKSQDEAERLSVSQFRFWSRVRSWFERLGTLWASIGDTIFRRRRTHESDSYSNEPSSPYALLEADAECLELPEVFSEHSDRPENLSESLSLEVGALRDQIQSQQEDLARVTSQLTDLKSLVLSQQQVLLHLGKEMEGVHVAASAPPPKTPRKIKPRVAKSSKSKTAVPKKRPNDQPPSVETHP